jgi:hypothetical protein
MALAGVVSTGMLDSRGSRSAGMLRANAAKMAALRFPRPRRPSGWLDSAQRLIEIRDDILNFLNSHRDPH